MHLILIDTVIKNYKFNDMKSQINATTLTDVGSENICFFVLNLQIAQYEYIGIKRNRKLKVLTRILMKSPIRTNNFFSIQQNL